MNEKNTFFIVTLGCKVNQYDAQALQEAWTGRGRAAADAMDGAGTIVVNSCAVTAKAVTEARRLLGRIRRDAPKARLILTGCAARAAASKFADIVGLEILLAEEALADGAPDGQASSLCDAYPACGVTDYGRARAVLKIQDGCSRRCTYCIVPDARGASRSRPFDAIMAEATRLFDAGFRELTVSAVNLSQYGLDIPGEKGLWEVVRALDALAASRPHPARLRLSSLDPGRLDETALDALAACGTLCPHLHISLQSAAPDVLRRMGRAATKPDALLRFLENVADLWPVFGLGADILTGFPGETDADFRQTLEFVREAPLTYGHVFPYSKRPGTPAANFPAQVAREVKKERAAALRQAASAKKTAFAERLAALPLVHPVIETTDPPGGSCEYYIDCRFETAPSGTDPVPGLAPREIVPARPLRAEDGALVVAPLADTPGGAL